METTQVRVMAVQALAAMEERAAPVVAEHIPEQAHRPAAVAALGVWPAAAAKAVLAARGAPAARAAAPLCWRLGAC